jgi:hypothetical protein
LLCWILIILETILQMYLSREDKHNLIKKPIHHLKTILFSLCYSILLFYIFHLGLCTVTHLRWTMTCYRKFIILGPLTKLVHENNYFFNSDIWDVMKYVFNGTLCNFVLLMILWVFSLWTLFYKKFWNNGIILKLCFNLFLFW